ncbi:hypothetical protein KHQ81_06010 [Mycoplasmatota bacterium]|nr:hypothetical protein KHQ81_06010 [Mycoplasmatota bacterium]
MLNIFLIPFLVINYSSLYYEESSKLNLFNENCKMIKKTKSYFGKRTVYFTTTYTRYLAILLMSNNIINEDKINTLNTNLYKSNIQRNLIKSVKLFKIKHLLAECFVIAGIFISYEL